MKMWAIYERGSLMRETMDQPLLLLTSESKDALVQGMEEWAFDGYSAQAVEVSIAPTRDQSR